MHIFEFVHANLAVFSSTNVDLSVHFLAHKHPNTTRSNTTRISTNTFFSGLLLLKSNEDFESVLSDWYSYRHVSVKKKK